MDALIALILCIVIALLIPVRWDPAFWLMNWNEKWRRKS